MLVRYFSHATFQIVTRSRLRLLCDPWLYQPIYGNTLWQFPKCPFTLQEYVDQDIIYISHDHPDHFCPQTLSHFDPTIPVIIRRYPAYVAIKPSLIAMGFQTIIELEDRETVTPLPGLTVTLIADKTNTDSALIISDGEHTLLDQNDCKLNTEGWQWVGSNFSIDLSLQSYGATNLFPASFEMPWEDKMKALQARTLHQLSNAAMTAELIGSPLVVPAANDLALMLRPDLDPFYAALPTDFRDFAASAKCPFEVMLMNPGDTFSFTERPGSYAGQFKNRSEHLAAIALARMDPKIIEVGEVLETWERSFQLDDIFFTRLFAGFCQYAHVTGVPVLKPTDNLRVGFRAVEEGHSTEWIVHYGPNGNSLERSNQSLDEVEGLYMIVSVEAHLLAMAQAGAITFEDLMNCRWQVRRFAVFGQHEISFWAFLSAFSAYLDSIGMQPEKANRSRVKYLAIGAQPASNLDGIR
jgi:L-ascorbate metabolism protein UlaG (beta-lactamase superfamily)